jgi:hypothetical protein
MIYSHNILSWKLEGKRPLLDVGLDWKVIFKRVLKE